MVMGMPDEIARPAFPADPLALKFSRRAPAYARSLSSDCKRGPRGLRPRLFRTQAWLVCTRSPLAEDRPRGLELQRLVAGAGTFLRTHSSSVLAEFQRDQSSDDFAAALRVLRVRSRRGTQRIAHRALGSRASAAQLGVCILLCSAHTLTRLQNDPRGACPSDAVPLACIPTAHKIVHYTPASRRRAPEFEPYARVHVRHAPVKSERDPSGPRAHAFSVLSWWVHIEDPPRRSRTWSVSSATRCVALPTHIACADAFTARSGRVSFAPLKGIPWSRTRVSEKSNHADHAANARAYSVSLRSRMGDVPSREDDVPFRAEHISMSVGEQGEEIAHRGLPSHPGLFKLHPHALPYVRRVPTKVRPDLGCSTFRLAGAQAKSGPPMQNRSPCAEFSFPRRVNWYVRCTICKACAQRVTAFLERSKLLRCDTVPRCTPKIVCPVLALCPSALRLGVRILVLIAH